MNREAKKDKAEDKMIADFKISASRLIEMIKIIYLSRKTFSAYTKRSTDKYYSTDIRLQGNGIRFIFNKKGKIEAEVWDEIHGLCRMKLVRRSYILEDKEHALITLKADLIFLFRSLCEGTIWGIKWELLMEHLAGCRDKGALVTWKEGFELYEKYMEKYG